MEPSGGRRSQPGGERGPARQAPSEGHGEGKKGLCNVSAALEGAFSSLNRVTEATPTAYPARGLRTVVRATKWDVGLRDVCANKEFRRQLGDVVGEGRTQGCWRGGISFLDGSLIQIHLFILLKQPQAN